jgi:hypothetical protein
MQSTVMWSMKRRGEPFAWPAGTMEGAGQTLVAAGRELKLPSCCQSLAGTSEFTAEIDNDGTFEVASGTLGLQGLLMNYSGTTNSLTGGAYVARNATLELPGTPLGVNAATIVLDGPTARLLSREFEGDTPVDSLADLLRNAGAGELRLEDGAEVTTGGALRNLGLVEIGADSTLTAGGAYTQAAGRTEFTDPYEPARGDLVRPDRRPAGGRDRPGRSWSRERRRRGRTRRNVVRRDALTPGRAPSFEAVSQPVPPTLARARSPRGTWEKTA